MDFTKGNIYRSIFVFSIPIILGNLFQQLYSLVNSIFVGKYLGVDELAAVGSVYPVTFFITSMVLGIGSGGSVVVSHYYGAKDYQTIHKVISTFYIFFILLGIVICCLGIVFADNIFSLLYLSSSVHPLAVTYFKIYMLGMFFSVIFHSAVSILRGLGDATTQLYFLIPANILNIFLSYFFLGIMHWGIEASAWASFISQFMAFACLFIFLRKKHEFVHLPSLKHLYFNKLYLKKIVDLGIPTGLQQSIVSLTQILILSLVTSFGTDAVAGYSAAVRVESIALILVLNIGQALTSFVGTNIGAKNITRAKKGLFVSIKIMFTISIFIFLIFFFWDKELIQLFTSKESVITIGGEYLVVDALFWVLFGVMMMFTSYYRGVGYALTTFIISFVTLLLVRIPLSWWLSQNYGLLGIWLGAPFAWLLAITIYIFCFKYFKIDFSKVLNTH